MTENKLIQKYVEDSWAHFNKDGTDVMTLENARKCLKKVLVDMLGKSDLFRELDFQQRMQESGLGASSGLSKSSLSEITLSIVESIITGLAPEVRQIVYSYLSLQDMVKTISKLSKTERTILERSTIAKKDRTY